LEKGAYKSSRKVVDHDKCKKRILEIPQKENLGIPCKDLEGHIFTIGSGNNGKDGDMLLRTSMERIATYIGTKYGNEAAQ
jgi:hypothetical protein